MHCIFFKLLITIVVYLLKLKCFAGKYLALRTYRLPALLILKIRIKNRKQLIFNF